MEHPAHSPRGGRALALLLPLALFAAAPALAAPQGPPAVVHVDAVREEVVLRRQQVTGDLRAARRVEVATREKGLVLELAAQEGSVVEAGEVLARIDATQLELDLAVVEAQRAPVLATRAVRESELQIAERDVASLEALVEKRAANPKELADARDQVTAAEARLSASAAELEVLDAQAAKLRQRIADAELRAPFAGTVVQVRTEVGAWLGEGAAVAQLVSTGELEVWLEVPQQLFGALAGFAGAIEVEVGGTGRGFSVSAVEVVPDVDLRSRTFYVVADVKAALPLAAGMSITALVPTEEERPMLTISRDAILRNEVGSYVYAVLPGAEGQPPSAAPMQVQVLFQSEGRAVIRAGRLQAGMQVVVEGNERLYPMAPIQPVPAGGGAPAR